jgi:nescient helix-loop-helix protein
MVYGMEIDHKIASSITSLGRDPLSGLACENLNTMNTRQQQQIHNVNQNFANYHNNSSNIHNFDSSFMNNTRLQPITTPPVSPNAVTLVTTTSGSKRRNTQPATTTLQPSDLVGLTREERRRRRRATQKYRTAHATRERIRVEAFNVAFSDLRKLLPTLPPDKKLSKIEILKLALCYIAYLNHVLET